MPLTLSPTSTAMLIASARIGIGLTALAGPQIGGRAFTSGHLPAEALDGWRLAGARDIALGVGVLLAARRGPERMRGWTEAGALADLLDVAIMANSSGLRPAVKVAGAAAALAAAVAGLAAARQL